MNFKIVSTGQRTGNLNEDPKLRVYPDVSRFKLNANAVKLLNCIAGESVTMLADVESKLIAIHKSLPKVNKAGNVVMKPVRLTDEQKSELLANGEDFPMEIDYSNGCKLGKHFEFSSGYTVNAIDVKKPIVCDLQQTVKGSEIGLTDVSTVLIFDYSKETEETEEDNE